MANPGAAHPRVGAAPRDRQLIVNFGVFLISTAGAIVVVVDTAGNPSSIDDPAYVYALIAFLLFLLGIWFALLALVATQFPRAARIAVVIARGLHRYLLAGN